MIQHHQLRRALLIAAIYLSTSVVLNELQQRHLVSAEAAVRMMNILIGMLVMVCANAIPKQLVPLARLSCAPTREQILRRFCGWAGVLGGLGHTLAYAFAPIAIASTLATCILAPAALLVAGIAVRCVWVRLTARPSGA